MGTGVRVGQGEGMASWADAQEWGWVPEQQDEPQTWNPETGLLGRVSWWRGTRSGASRNKGAGARLPLPVTSQGLAGGPDG